MQVRPSMSVQNLMADSDAANDESWMTSYIDVFVLMTSIFVVLFMLSRPDAETNQQASEFTLAQAESKISDKALIREIYHDSWSGKIKQTIHQNQLSSHVAFLENQAFSELEIRSQVLFDSGAAILSRSGEAVLQKLVPVLNATEGLIFIEGHTDNMPIQSREFISNWELASARATEVLQFFVLEGVAKHKLRAVSYGDTKPLVPNDTEANRQQNRRVSIVLQSPQ